MTRKGKVNCRVSLIIDGLFKIRKTEKGRADQMREKHSLSTCSEVENESLFDLFDWLVERSNQNQNNESIDESITVSKRSQNHIN